MALPHLPREVPSTRGDRHGCTGQAVLSKKPKDNIQKKPKSQRTCFRRVNLNGTGRFLPSFRLAFVHGFMASQPDTFVFLFSQYLYHLCIFCSRILIACTVIPGTSRTNTKRQVRQG